MLGRRSQNFRKKLSELWERPIVGHHRTAFKGGIKEGKGNISLIDSDGNNGDPKLLGPP